MNDSRTSKSLASEPAISVRLRGESRRYFPGQTIEGEYRLELPSVAKLKAVEVSVMWYSEGKGDEDLGIHFFERIVLEKQPELDVSQPIPFKATLPSSPLSYDGLIVRIHWCVRVRVFLSRGRQVMSEQPFVLGDVAPAQRVEVANPPPSDEDLAEPTAAQ